MSWGWFIVRRCSTGVQNEKQSSENGQNMGPLNISGLKDVKISRFNGQTLSNNKRIPIKQNSASGPGNSWSTRWWFRVYTLIHRACSAILYKVWKAITQWQKAYGTTSTAEHVHLSVDSEGARTEVQQHLSNRAPNMHTKQQLLSVRQIKLCKW